MPRPDPTRSPAGPRLCVSLEAPDADPPLNGWLDAQLGRAFDHLRLPPGTDVRFVIVDDTAMTRLHREYLQLDSTTDVLTFDLRENPGDALDGDVVVCLDEAARQAAARGHEARVEVLLYAVHGLMHLLGEDDHDDAAFDRMHRREDALLEAIGVGPVFGRGDST